jgi:hypothetical protein
MAANIKPGIGLSIVGFTFAVTGFVFSSTGNSAIGIPILTVGMFLITAGLATARKAPPPEKSPGIQLPVEGTSRRA